MTAYSFHSTTDSAAQIELAAVLHPSYINVTDLFILVAFIMKATKMNTTDPMTKQVPQMQYLIGFYIINYMIKIY